MADMKPQVYKDPRPAEEFTRFHEWVRTHRPGWIYELVRLVVTPLLWFVYRGWALDAENVPKDGAFILAPNHFSNLDHFFAGVFIRRKIQFMAKSQLYGNPILNYIFRVGGVFPVRRGHHDEEAFITAAAVLKRGGCVGMYCEGGRSRSGRLGEPKAGVGRLALESGVPGRAPGDPWHLRRSGLEAPQVPQGDAPVRRADQLPAQPVALARGGARRFPPGLRPREGHVRGARGRGPQGRGGANQGR